LFQVEIVVVWPIEWPCVVEECVGVSPKKLSLGNFETLGNAVGVVADVSLIALRGKLKNKNFEFLLDSGASSNFISK
jgi:hypothetical protein